MIIVLGFWIAIVSFLGFPNAWDRVILLISGLSVSVLMFLLRRDFFSYVEQLRLRQRRKRESDTYVENDIRVEPKVTVSPRVTVVPEIPLVETAVVIEPSNHVEVERPRRARKQQ